MHLQRSQCFWQEACSQVAAAPRLARPRAPLPAPPQPQPAPQPRPARPQPSVDDAKAKLDDADYVFFDVRKAEDYATSHIPGALSYDMDAAKEGDFEAGVATMSQATQDLDKNIVVICYSGKKYAQAATNTLSALGYDMSKVYTLEGGFKAWTEGGNDVEASEEVAAPAEDVAMNYISPEDTKAKLDDDTYTIIDLRKKADYDAGHIATSPAPSLRTLTAWSAAATSAPASCPCSWPSAWTATTSFLFAIPASATRRLAPTS